MIEPVASETKGEIFHAPAMNKMLYNRMTENGQHVVLFNVPEAVGTESKRYCDAISIGMWGSTGRLIQGYEMKSSRSDWLRELRDTTKADPFIARCDRWWLVTGNKSIAKPDELPECWGWMNATNAGLRIEKPAPALPPKELNRLWALALIRCASYRSQEADAAARDTMREEERKRADDEIALRIARSDPAYAELKRRVEEFEKKSGLTFDDWRLGNITPMLGVLNRSHFDDYYSLRTTMTRQLECLQGLVKETKDLLTITLPAPKP